MMMKQNSLTFVNLLLIAFSMGIFLAYHFTVSFLLLYSLIFIVLIISFFSVGKNFFGIEYSLLLLFLLIGFMRSAQDMTLATNDISFSIGKNLTVLGKVVDAPVIKVKEDGMVSVKYIIEIDEAWKNKQKELIAGNMIVYTKEKATAKIACYGDKIKVNGEIKQIHGYRNPGLIDREAALKRQGITAQMYVTKNTAQIYENKDANFKKSIDRMRDHLLKAMKKVMSEYDAAALFAMLFGGYGGIKPEFLEAFTATGIVHILSVSGSHIALLAATLQQIGNFLRIKPIFTAFYIIIVIFCYCTFSGFVPPVIRSSIMGILTFGAMALGREKDGRRILALTGLSMLVFKPHLIFDISFQLSFGATAGLLYLSPYVQRKFSFLPKWLAANLALTIAAQLSVLPFLAWYFNTLSLSALISNLVAVPIVEYIIIFGLLGAVIGMLIPFVQNIFFVLCSLSLGLVYNITSAVAAIPGGNIYLPSGGMIIGLVYYFLLGLVVYNDKFYRIKFKSYIISSCIILFTFVLWFGIKPDGLVRVHFIDVGQGDATLVTTPTKKAVLIDTGGILQSKSDFDVGARVVVPYLKHYGITEIEYLILTHAHEDHAGGAKAVYKKIKVNHILIGREDKIEYAKVFQTSLENMPTCIPAYQGQKFAVDGVDFEVLAAMDGVKLKTGNEVSNVIKISYGQHSFLITGDLDANGENLLLQEGAVLSSSVLKVGHHGSKTSSTVDFIKQVNPIYAMISVGADNAFGHPSNVVVERLKENQAIIYRTDDDGAIVCETDGKNLKVTTFMENR